MNKGQKRKIDDLNARMDDFHQVNGADPEGYDADAKAEFLSLHREAQRMGGFERQSKLPSGDKADGQKAGPQETSLKQRLELLEKQVAAISFRSSDPTIQITGKFPHFIIAVRRGR